MVFVHDFVTFGGEKKNWIKKTFFVWKKYVNSLRRKKNVIEKKTINFFSVEKIE
jgi:hypothetical protein